MSGNAFGGGERHDAVGIGIVADGGGESDVDAGARQIDGGIEGIAAAGQRELPSAPRANSISTSPTQTARAFCSLMLFLPGAAESCRG